MLSVRPLPPDLAEKARVELFEEPARLPADVQHLKDWIARQPHLRARTDDQWLVSFLRGCKFSLERTKEKIDLFYSVKTTAPEFFKISVKDPKFYEILELGSYLVLPKTTRMNPTVTIISPGKYDPDKYSISDIISVTHTIEKILIMEDDNAIISGGRAILDLENVTLSHFVQMSPANMKKMVVIGQDSLPFRVKGVHYLNTPTGFETVFNVMKSLLNNKNKQRLYVHNKNYEEMYKYIPKDVLPSEYGGNGGTAQEIIDDQWLVSFLRGCKFSLERTKEKIDLFYAARTTAPEFFKISVKDPKFFEILELGSYLILPNTTKANPVVAIISPGKYDPDKYSISDVVSLKNTLEKILIKEDDNAVISGLRIILNLENVTLSHFLQMTPTVMKKMVVIGQDSTPFRMKGVHYLNTPTGFETVFNAIKSLLNNKNQQRLYVHNKNYEEMYNHIPKGILTTEYGGHGGTTQDIIDYWKKKVEEHRAWLEEDEQFGTDESRRPGKPKTAEDMFGVEGSFRQLQFD